MGKPEHDPRWYERFFEGLAVDIWEQAVPAAATIAEVAFLVEELGLSSGARVLDVPCGNGRHARELARRGMRPIGVDLSAEFLARAERHAADERVEVEWHRGDMRALAEVGPVLTSGELDGAFCFGNSFGYLEPAGTRAFLGAVHDALHPGARFALDTGTAAESLLPELQQNRWMRVGDMLFLSSARYDAPASRLDTEYTFARGEHQETRTASHHVHTAAEIRRMLEEAGLRPIAAYGSTERTPFELGSPRLLLVAERT